MKMLSEVIAKVSSQQDLDHQVETTQYISDYTRKNQLIINYSKDKEVKQTYISRI